VCKEAALINKKCDAAVSIRLSEKLSKIPKFKRIKIGDKENMRNEKEFYSAHNHCEDVTSMGHGCFMFIRIIQNKLYETSVRFGKRHKNLRTREHRKLYLSWNDKVHEF
jgi:hypothetical protein